MAAVAKPVECLSEHFPDWLNPEPVTELISGSTELITDVAGIVADYIASGRIGAFASNFWRERGVDAGIVRPIEPEFFNYWYGLDPVDPERRVCDTHHWPVWIPEGLSLASVERAGLRFNPDNTEGLEKHRYTNTCGGYYAVMRKEVLGRDLPKAEQIQQLKTAGYPGLAHAADLAAVIFAINQQDGSRWLGNDTGAENRWTYTRCVENIGSFISRDPLVIGGFSSSGVGVGGNSYRAHDDIGVAALQMF